MTTYRNIHGRAIQSLATDPTESVAEGQIWYNTSSDTFKSVVASEAWSSSSPVIKNTYRAGSAGTQTSALLFAGSSNPPFSFFTDTQEYNGSGWSSGGAMAQARWGLRGAGTQTAGLGFGGYIGPPGPPSKNSALTEEYNGTAWTTSPNSMGSGRYALGGAGTQTSALGFGGQTYPGSAGTATEEYDGSSWTAGGVLPSARTRLSGCGPSNNDALAVGTQTSGVCSTYNGTAWTDTGSLGTARYRGGSSGSTSSAITYGGSTYPGVTVKNLTESFDGSTWSASPATMGTARYAFGYAGVVDSALAMSGHTTAMTGVTEEYTVSANVITAAAWSSGGLMGAGRYQGNGQNVGTKNAGMYAGGRGSFPSTAPAVTVSNVEEYDGSSWSEVNNLPESKAMFGAVGTQTAAFVFGGYGGPGAGPNPGPGGSPKSAALNYDGTNWTASPYSLPSAVAYLTGVGTSTAALSIGGHPASQTCNEYDGEGWTAGGSMTTGRHNSSAFGTQTAAIVAGGAPGASVEVDAESYNGTSWTAAANLIVNKGQAGTAGTQTDGLVFLGNAANPTNTIGWNGTSWFTQPSTSTARYGGSNGSTTLASAYYAGGGGSASGTTRQTTEEFTAESSVVTASTLTSS